MAGKPQGNLVIRTSLPFPFNGLDQTQSYLAQRPLTSVSEMNVRSFEPSTGRMRGSVRQGLVKVANLQINGSNPIQDIAALDTVTAPPIVPYDGFIYAEAAGSGFGIAANSTGSSVQAGLAAVASFSFENSCWDVTGNLYVATRNGSANAAGKLYQFSYNFVPGGTAQAGATNTITLAVGASSTTNFYVGQKITITSGTGSGQTGTVAGYNGSTLVATMSANWTTPPDATSVYAPAPNWGPVATPTLSDVPARCVAGMTVIGNLLFVAYLTSTGNTGAIYVYNAINGLIANAAWVALQFSTASHNCLGSIGLTLGVATYNQGFKTYLIPALAASKPSALVANQLPATTTAITGTPGNEATKVVSDGTANFYVITAVTTSMLCKITMAGAISWQVSTLDTGNGGAGKVALSVCYDNGGTNGTPQLVGLSTGTTKAISINLATGALLAAITSTVASWTEIDSDNQGNFTLWENSQAANDVIGLNNTLAVKWGPSTLANVVHTGCSVSKAPARTPQNTTTRQIRVLTVSGGLVQRFNVQLTGSITSGSNIITYSSYSGGLPSVNMGVWGPGIPAGAYVTATGTNQITISASATATTVSSVILLFGPIALTGMGGQTLHPSAVIFSAQNGLNLFYADGAGYFYYNAQSDAMKAWTASTSGTMPTDGPDKTVARQIETWRGRTVLFGFPSNGQALYFSAINDAFNWNTSPTTPTSSQAVVMTASLGGFGGDILVGFVPYDDDTAIIICQHSIWQMTGDPAAGGQLDLISGGGPGSNGVGGAWGRAWCKDPIGQVWFFGSQSGIWKIVPGSLPVRQSQQIEKQVEKIDLSLNVVKMYYDLQNQAVMVYISPLTVGPTTNFCWEERLNAWHPDSFLTAAMQPLTTYINGSDSPDSRLIMLGSQDGYVRCYNSAAVDDDGTAIAWNVFLGPLVDKQLEELMLVDAQATLGSNSGAVTWSVYVGKTAEDAFNSSPVVSGVWSTGTYIAGSGRNHMSYIRRAGIAIYLKLSGTAQASFEKIMCSTMRLGRIRSRQ